MKIIPFLIALFFVGCSAERVVFRESAIEVYRNHRGCRCLGDMVRIVNIKPGFHDMKDSRVFYKAAHQPDQLEVASGNYEIEKMYVAMEFYEDSLSHMSGKYYYK